MRPEMLVLDEVEVPWTWEDLEEALKAFPASLCLPPIRVEHLPEPDVIVEGG